MRREQDGKRQVVQSTAVDSRGRLTLPRLVRQHLGTLPGSRLTFTPSSNGSFIVSVVLDEEQSPGKVELTEALGKRMVLAIDTTSALIRKGHLIPVAEFQERMGWATRHAVWNALAKKRVFVMGRGAELYFPTFYFDRAYDRRHLEAVTKALGNLPGGAKLQFFVARKGSLGGKTVLEAIAAGQIEKVLRLAVAYAEA